MKAAVTEKLLRSLLAKGACFAGRALVHAVLEEPPLSLEFGSKP